MKKKVLALAAAITLVAPLKSFFAIEETFFYLYKGK